MPGKLSAAALAQGQIQGQIQGQGRDQTRAQGQRQIQGQVFPGTVMYCIGAQRSGTSWLYRYLSEHPGCALRSIKEIHYFDCQRGPDLARPHADRARRLDALNAEIGAASALHRPEFKVRRRDDIADLLSVMRDTRSDDAAYLDYLTLNRTETRLVGDITPAYALLDADGFRRMVAIAPDTRFVFILRNPVDRAWSQARRMASRSGAADPAAALALFDAFLDGGQDDIADRSDYARTLRALDAALDPRQLHVLFYEEIFQPATLTALTDFLGIAPRPAQPETVVLAGEPQLLPESRRNAAIAHLKPQVEFVQSRGSRRLPSAWTAGT